MSDEDRKHLIRADELPGATRRHPLNPRSTISVRPVSRAAGMERLGISVATLPPGNEAFVYHSHESEEEFLYIVSGRGQLKVDGELIDVGPGDFMGFPAPSVAHQLVNPYAEDLVYVMGGENHPVEIASFPELGSRLYRGITGIDVVDEDHVRRPFAPNDDDTNQ